MTNQDATYILSGLRKSLHEYCGLNDNAHKVFDMAISALQTQDVPDTNVGDMISRQGAIDALRVAYWDDNIQSAKDDPCIVDAMTDWAIRQVKALPSAQPEWNNHTVACLLAELFDDTCACNYNGIDEWLPRKCELLDSCPNPVGVACWEQYLKHRAERRTDE